MFILDTYFKRSMNKGRERLGGGWRERWVLDKALTHLVAAEFDNLFTSDEKDIEVRWKFWPDYNYTSILSLLFERHTAHHTSYTVHEP